MSQGDVNLEISPGGVAEAQQFQWLEPEREDFNTAFTEIQKGFQSRGLKKALPVVFAKARVDFKSKQRIALLSRALAAPKELFGYGLWREIESGLSEGMVGATPEILFQARATSTGSEVETVAIAGTRGKNQPGGAEELMRDPKERHEHQVVIDDIAEVLKPLGEVHLSETRVLELPTLFHLHTPIRLRSGEQIDFNRLVKILHPTPALGVSPRALGFEEMWRWDSPERRGRFGAPFGAVMHEAGKTPELHCVVAIRNVQWLGAQAEIGSGCGIVPASVADREWQELHLKRESVKRLLGL
jgi:menaquinone-specific isochorismate synthase